MRSRTLWREYLPGYHDTHAGITEALLRRCSEDPYRWLLNGEHTIGDRVMDLACGSAPLFDQLQQARYLGVDASGPELRLAAARGAEPLVQADATCLPLPDSSFDVVVCSMALQVLTPLPMVLAELARVLRPQGRLIAMLPVSGPLTAGDRLRYARVLRRLRRLRLGYANPHPLHALRSSGWTIHSRQSRRFGYPINAPEDGQRLIDAFYLPGSTAQRQASAAALAGRWTGLEIGIPLQRIIATPPA